VRVDRILTSGVGRLSAEYLGYDAGGLRWHQHGILDARCFACGSVLSKISGRGFLGLSQIGVSAHLVKSEPSADASYEHGSAVTDGSLP